MYINDSIAKNENQPEFLSDKKKNGEERPWKEKKTSNEFLVESYGRLGNIYRETRAGLCGCYLKYKVYENNEKHLAEAKFCQLPLCPMCSWRRELRIFSNLSKVIDKVVQEDKNLRFIFLTLTCENVAGKDLIAAENAMFKGFDAIMRYKRVKQVAKGFFRAMEITHDVNYKITREMYRKKWRYYDGIGLHMGNLNPNYNKYHPHFHIIIAVDKTYFTDPKQYLKQSDWTQLWQKALRVDYTPVVHVEAVDDIKGGGINEVAKYTVKDSEYLVKTDKLLTDETVATLDEALHNRRLIAYGGILKEARKGMNLKDENKAGVEVDEDGEVHELPYYIVQYNWHTGFKNYVLAQVIEQ